MGEAAGSVGEVGEGWSGFYVHGGDRHCGRVGVAQMDGNEDEDGERGGGGECHHPTGEPWPTQCDGLRRRERLGNARLSEVDDGAAVGAGGEVGERRLLLMDRQRVLGEGVELIRVGVLAGLEGGGHSDARGWRVAGCARVV